ncbi:MAG: alpha-1,4-glucan--maltose-1-phosphate maltosyltransferase [Dehalococcoidales bacterium]|nr:alpha-1,4-glucan--maltose-1-phosphate maltosyltransferase [Dehalococcoidales bacterium]
MNDENMKNEMQLTEGRTRIVIEGIKPEIDGGCFAVKRVIGDRVEVEADIFADGHDVISARLLYRKESEADWAEIPLESLVNDRWRGSFTVGEVGRYYYTVTAWIDDFKTWRQDFVKRVEAKQEDIGVNLIIGAQMVAAAAARASGADAEKLKLWKRKLQAKQTRLADKIPLILGEEPAQLMEKYAERKFAVTYRELAVTVDRARASFSSWYEMFPRSASPQPGQHGNFKDCEARLPYIAGMGFDILYLPPIHLIGQTNRKGKNNALTSQPDDPGTPWAIGSEEGGHKAIHPQLGTLADFRHLVAKAKDYGIEVALDIALQCSPDHPYVKQHPEWFRWRPDGTVQYAENPPKKYQDIYPLNFETEHWPELWEEMKSIFLFWIEQGIRIFRVDNPHTKPFRFWEWLIGEIRKDRPDIIFLSEAFTRPKIMYRLAKLGFTQSYTYFTWRHSKWELSQYLTELTQTEVREFFRPSLWTNTPDILTPHLQTGGRPAFMARLVLAATLSTSYGIYGPAFELGEHLPREAGSEEYLNSEKYELKHWDIARPDSLKDFITVVNRARRENPALQNNHSLQFHNVGNDQIIAYSKHNEDKTNIILTVVNLDSRRTQSAFVDIPIEALDIAPRQPYVVHDLLNDARYTWQGTHNYVELNPGICPAHIFRIEK